jgi:hypothetical protein
MQAIFRHFGDYWWDFRHLVALRLGVFALQRVPTAAAHVRFNVMALFDLLDRYQFPRCALVSWLCPALSTPVWFGHLGPVIGWRL